ncbi:glycosyltransferase family 2 protein [Verticiella sediminum]|uniref:Glycosyltransferase family 2 protein n=1 Tax=Verticiella sediminum TaxID=1247510 RepID=A0A556AC41_9BURK|nr:glycosyltransferase family 2 protein [Verticiella sediminum]TSH90451.1 glycosyltransferase family 2 protein [Verticiella sediminum]
MSLPTISRVLAAWGVGGCVRRLSIAIAQSPWTLPAAAPSVPADARLARVAVLLCTYHGQRYLGEQLESIARQTHGRWRLWVSDDGSQDDTPAILDAYRSAWPAGRMAIRPGPRAGVARNFLQLACLDAVGEEADYFAYSDQDDIWEPDKLERAVAWLQRVPADVPALYCSRTRLVDENNAEIGLSPLFTRPASFANALVQNIGGGNTMVFNRAARALLRETGAGVPAALHDWWTYLVVIGCGGQVHYDAYPGLRYRQHRSNQFGSNATWLAKAVRIRALWRGRFRQWNDGNIAALRMLAPRLTPANRDLLERFAKARDMRLVPRLVHLKACGIHRQTMLGNLGLLAAAVLKKI